MQEPMKFTIVGAGSSYTPELIEEMANRRDALPVKELVLYDIDPERLSIMGGFARRYADRLGLRAEIRCTTDLDDALYGAAFVDTQIRVGGNVQRVKDEKIPMMMEIINRVTGGLHKPDTGVAFKGFQLPEWEEMLQIVREMSGKLDNIRYVGWDMAYSKKGWAVVEGNGMSQMIASQFIYKKGIKEEVEGYMADMDLILPLP